MDAGHRVPPRLPAGGPGDPRRPAGGPGGPGGPGAAGPVPGVRFDGTGGSAADLRADQAAGAVVRTPARLAADGRPVWVTVVVEALDGVTRKRIRTSSQSVLAASRLPDVATLLPWLDVGEDAEGRPYLVAARVGPSLVTISPATPDRPALALAVLRDVAAALAGVHGAGLVHGGVGAAAVEHLQGTSSLVLAPPLPVPVAELVTAVGGGTGMEPVEILAGRSWSAAGDVAALCALVAAVATGRPVLPATAAAQAARLHRLTGEEEHPDLRDALPPAAAAAVLEGLRRDPSLRPTARDLLRAAGAPDVVVATDGEVETIPPRRGAAPAPDAGLGLGETVGRPLGSRYLLDEVIGRGASGRVWRGRRRGDGTPVAVKVLRSDLAEDPDVVLRFLRERTTLTGLLHPHLVRVLDLVAEGDTLAIVMDLVDGRDLTAAGPLPAATACRLLGQTAEALDAVHAAGVVHRDLKPANILLAERDGAPWAMLTDFGLARAVDSTALTRMSQLVGTPAYLAPELVAGREPTPAADVYALGVTAYELLAGERPFGGESAASLMRAHLDTAPSRPAAVSDAVWSLLSACLAKDPRARPEARTVAAAFATLAAGGDDVVQADGAASNGAPGNGALTNGALSNGALSNGSLSNGALSNGALRDDGRAGDRGWAASSWGAASQVVPIPVREESTDVRGGGRPEEPPADETALSRRPAPEGRPAPPAPRRRRRWPWVAAAAAVVVVGVGSGVLLAAGGGGDGGSPAPNGTSGGGALTSFPVTTEVGTSSSGLPVVYWDTAGLTGTDFFLLTSGNGVTLGTTIDAGEDRTVVTDASPDGCYLVLAVGADSPPPTDTPAPACLRSSADPSGTTPTSSGATP